MLVYLLTFMLIDCFAFCLVIILSKLFFIIFVVFSPFLRLCSFVKHFTLILYLYLLSVFACVTQNTFYLGINFFFKKYIVIYEKLSKLITIYNILESTSSILSNLFLASLLLLLRLLVMGFSSSSTGSVSRNSFAKSIRIFRNRYGSIFLAK